MSLILGDFGRLVKNFYKFGDLVYFSPYILMFWANAQFFWREAMTMASCSPYRRASVLLRAARVELPVPTPKLILG